MSGIAGESWGEYYFEMKIVTYGNEILRKRAEQVEEFNDEIRDLIENMYETMVESRGYGVAGPQVGVSKRIFVYDVGEGQHALINPVLVSSKGEEWGVVGCLSVPGLQGEVLRADRAVVTGIDENGNKVKIKADGLLARVFQHEMDHLDGTIFVDRADPDTLETVPLRDDEEED
jgi:peptide deformylase